MICDKCGNDYSLKVWRIHRQRCIGDEHAIQRETKEEGRQEISIDDVEIVEDMSKAELVEIAEAFGVTIDKRWSKARIAEALNDVR